MSLQKKIIVSFLISSALMAFLAGTFFLSFIEIRREIRYLELSDTLRSKTLQLRRHEKNFFLYGENAESEKVHTYLKDLKLILSKAEEDFPVGLLGQLHLKVEEYDRRFHHIQEIARDFRTSFKELNGRSRTHAAFSPIIEATFLERPLVNAALLQKLFPSNSVSGITAALRTLDTEIVSLRKNGEEILVMSKDLDRSARDKADRSIRMAQTASVILFPLSVLFGIGTLFAISRSVVRRLKVLASAIEQAGKGNFSELPVPLREDELSELVKTFNRMENDLIARDRELAAKREELFQSRKLASIGTLASGVAHELNNPLNNIYLSAQILSKEIGEDSCPGIVKETVGDIYSETLRVKRIVGDLLVFSREKPPDRRRIDILEVIRGIPRQMTASGDMRQVRFELDAPETAEALADRHLMEQVFINLFTNAVDAMEGTGALKVSVSSGSKLLRITVRDSGTGISEANRLKIFDPFFTTKEKGTGLGLAIVYSIIERHHGRIDVESAPGKGTAFTITLPLEDET